MQNFTQIEQSFDTALQTVLTSTSVTGINSIQLFTENKTMNFAMLPDMTQKLGVRTTLIPAKTIVETLGVGGYVSVNGNYAIDVFGQVNTGYVAVQTLSDALLAAFPRGLQFVLPNGDTIQINNASPSVNTNQGGWTMGKLYARQIIIEWQGYVIP
jgi:hypothetical protein